MRLASIVFVVLLVCGGLSPSLAKPASEFESIEWSKGLPVVVDHAAGKHRIGIRVDKAAPEASANPASYGEACESEDILTLTIWRDGTQIHSDVYCSAYQLAMVRLYEDAKGEPFLFLGSAYGRGTGATTSAVRFLEIGSRVEAQGGFDAGWTVGEDLYVSYDYKVSRPSSGGLIVDIRAMNTRAGVTSPGIPADACCVEDLVAVEEFRLGVARLERPDGVSGQP